tara:strand:- start:2799 stop:3263 length:465 start_codon:yes stop_codon:yes gene_type:complete
MFLFTDLAFDIEELITQELDVLLKFRKTTKQFKDLVEQNKNNLKRMKRLDSEQNQGYWRTTSNHYLKLATCGTHKKMHLPRNPMPTIYGFTYQSCIYMRNQVLTHHGLLEVTIAQLNDKLTELGATRFKSKNKKEKINLLMSDGKYHRRYALTN